MKHQPVETTLYSLSDASPRAPEERREDDRLMTLYRVGSLWIGESRELCLIKNICAGGMMVRAYCAIPEGTRVMVELKCGQPIAGVVSWARDVNVGINFDDPIDVIDVLATSMDGPRPRMPRVQVDCFITLREGASTYRVQLTDVSQGGLKIRCEAPVALGSDIVVTLAGIAPLPGVVRWVEGDYIGITFNHMLALPTLVEWLRCQRDSNRAAP